MPDYGKIRERNLFDMSPHGQSTLVTKIVAEQILEKWLEIISIILEIYSLNFEAIMEAELKELKHFCTMPFKDWKEIHLIEYNGCRILMKKFGIIGKTMTSNDKTVFRKHLVSYVSMWKTTYCQRIWARKVLQQRKNTANNSSLTMRLEFS